MPAFVTTAHASPNVSMITDSMKFPISFTRQACAGSAPTMPTDCPSCSSSGSATPRCSGAPAAMMKSLRAAAASGRPNTVAATKPQPASRCFAVSSCAVATPIVLIETCSAPGFSPAAMPASPNVTVCSAASSATIENTTSAECAASAALRATAAPSSRSGSAREVLRLKTCTSCPDSTRFVAIAAPIAPSPMNPIFMISSSPRRMQQPRRANWPAATGAP